MHWNRRYFKRISRVSPSPFVSRLSLSSGIFERLAPNNKIAMPTDSPVSSTQNGHSNHSKDDVGYESTVVTSDSSGEDDKECGSRVRRFSEEFDLKGVGSVATNTQSDSDVGSQISIVKSELRMYETPLSKPEIVMVMQGWNKVLAFTTAFTQALAIKWRLLCTIYVHEHSITEDDYSSEEEGGDDNHQQQHHHHKMTNHRAMDAIDKNMDPLAKCLGQRIEEFEELLLRLIDHGVRSTCPRHQTVQREAYRSLEDQHKLEKPSDLFGALEVDTPQDIYKLFTRRGVLPEYWKLFVDAFLWCMKTHVPYAKDDDYEELNKPYNAFGKVITQKVVLPAIQCYNETRKFLRSNLFTIGVTRFWGRLPEDAKAGFGESFYKTLLEDNPELLDYFARTDMDALAFHLMQTLSLLVQCMLQLCDATNTFRAALDSLGDRHRKLGVPTYTYPIIGAHLLKCLAPLLEMEEGLTKDDDTYVVTAAMLTKAFAFLYTEVASLLHYPMLLQEKKIYDARKFYESIADELKWSEGKLGQRMLQVEQQIVSTGTYNQTTEEITWGARLAWRNSAKCIGRIAWKTLEIRDKRHVNSPEGVFTEVEEHLKRATAGTNIQSVMTVFAPKSHKSILGTRFWSSQYVRYAGYKDEKSGTITGDPANLELTNFLIKEGYWHPPEPRTRFDVLPIVLKLPHRPKPYVYELPKAVVFEVDIEHPTKPEITDLGYRWTTVPAISNFKMNLGGVVYQNMPFNGWFVSTEIVRNLMERYDAGPDVAKALGIDMGKNPCWRLLVSAELEVAVNHSFQKNGYTIVDPHTVGNQFCTHVQREREQHGRECPGQWSWIGGLTGPTNPTWHLEMRDYKLLPQYDYCAEDMTLFHDPLSEGGDEVGTASGDTADESGSFSSFLDTASIPRVLILYGSETGTAEGVARRIKREFGLLKPMVKSLDDAVGLGIVRTRNISHTIFVCSTFGKGDPPSNAARFMKSKILLRNTKMPEFAVLALGSTIYPDFCKAGETLDQKLADEGLERMVPLAKADEAAGAEEAISKFIALVKSLIMPPAVEAELVAMAESFEYEPIVTEFEWKGQVQHNMKRWSHEETMLCVHNEELLRGDNSSRSIKKISFQLPPGTEYKSGDHVSVNPFNRNQLVDRFIRLFEFELTSGSDPAFRDLSKEELLKLKSMTLFDLISIEEGERMGAEVFFKTPTTITQVLESYVDLSLSNKNVADILSVMKRFLDELFEKLDHMKGEYEVVAQDDLVVEISDLISSILESPPEKAAPATDRFVARFPTVVDLLGHFKSLFLDDFTTKTLGWKNARPILLLPECKL